MAPGLARAGPYELLKKLSSGGSGEVYVARHHGDEGEPRLAVKWMLPHLAAEPELVTRFLDEVRLAVRMRHPNIVRVLDVGMSEERPWLSMELVEGVSLYALLERCRQKPELLPLDVVRLIAANLLDALAYAHTLEGLNVVHRDVSPSNVLVSADGAVRLTDFGLARASTNWAKTRGGLDVKLGYTAPEISLGGTAVDQRADVFGAGVTLFEVLTLQQPFRRPGASDAQTLEAMNKGEAAKAAAARPAVSGAMEAALDKAIRPAAADRFATALELKAAFIDGPLATPEELGALVGRLCPEELARFFSLDEVPLEPFDVPTVTFTISGANAMPSRRRLLIAGGGVLCALAAGAVAVLAHRTPPPEPVMEAPLPELEVIEDVPDASAAPAEPDPEVELSPNEPAGFVSTEGEPAVPVLLDGKPLGTTPLHKVSVPPGRHTVIFKTKHGEVRRKIVIIDGKTMTLHIGR